VVEEKAADFGENVAVKYERKTGLKPNIYICAAENGAEVIK